jgi:benzoylformate decarboxylase
LKAFETTGFVGLDFDDPSLHMQGLAEGFGARVETIGTLDSVGDVLKRVHAHQGPSFLIINREP